MKTNAYLTLMAVVAGSLLLAAGCQTASVSPGSGSTSNPGTGFGTGTPTGQLRVSAPFANQTTQFAFDLARQINTQDGTAKNLFISPLSLHILLGMLLNGANGQTAAEIQKTLRLDAQTLAEANATYQNLRLNLPAVDPAVTLQLANSVWYRNTFAVAQSFQDVLKQTFDADVRAKDFSNPATVGEINAWASDKTNGKITKVLDQIQSDNVMFLLNALYFKGDWKARFDPAATLDMPFTLATGEQKTVRMMRQETNLRRAFRPGYVAFELPYGSDKYAMTILLPAAALGSTASTPPSADALLQTLTPDEWNQVQQAMTVSRMDIGVPKFTLNYAVTLNGALRALGMPTAFTDRADFTKINPGGGVLLSFVRQDTFVAVDEQGTEAAAVTTGGLTTTAIGAGPTLCDRPFVFVIHEKTSNTVLFVGKIADPTQTNTY